MNNDFWDEINRVLRRVSWRDFPDVMQDYVYPICRKYFPTAEPSGRFVIECYRRYKSFSMLDEDDVWEPDPWVNEE